MNDVNVVPRLKDVVNKPQERLLAVFFEVCGKDNPSLHLSAFEKPIILDSSR